MATFEEIRARMLAEREAFEREIADKKATHYGGHSIMSSQDMEDQVPHPRKFLQREPRLDVVLGHTKGSAWWLTDEFDDVAGWLLESEPEIKLVEFYYYSHNGISGVIWRFHTEEEAIFFKLRWSDFLLTV